MLVVGVGRTEAKVEGLFSEVCRLDYKGNVLDSMGGEVLKGGARSSCPRGSYFRKEENAEAYMSTFSFLLGRKGRDSGVFGRKGLLRSSHLA